MATSSLVSCSMRRVTRPTTSALATSYINSHCVSGLFGCYAIQAAPSMSSSLMLSTPPTPSPMHRRRVVITHCHLSTQPSPHDEPPSSSSSSSATLTALQSLPDLSPRILSKIHSQKCRHDEISSLLQHGGTDATTTTITTAANNNQEVTSLGKELSSLSLVSRLVDRVVEIHDERIALMELQREATDDDDELSTEISSELTTLHDELKVLSNKLLHSLVPVLNPNDETEVTSADAVIDIRAGTGGDEAALFAGELLAGYEAVAKRGGAEEGESNGCWDVEVLSLSTTDLGGVKEASLSVTSKSSSGGGYGSNSGGYSNNNSTGIDIDLDNNDTEAQDQQLLQQLGPYGFFQYESGVHRVQRVPINDNKLQTSAVSVAVLPSIPDSQITSSLPPEELKIETMRASGAGGQHVNTTESAVRITHIPTGIMAYMQEERSQHKNKAKGLKLVAARVHQLRREEAMQSRSQARSSLMGGGDRSERIRTYNYPQDRITDHRCKVSVSGVGTWLGGGGMVRKFGPSLYRMEREERVIALEDEEEDSETDNGDGGRNGKKKHQGKAKR